MQFITIYVFTQNYAAPINPIKDEHISNTESLGLSELANSVK